MPKLRILISGYIIRGPMGGMTWHHLHYFLGLHQMGHDVYFIEDSGDTMYSCYNPDKNSVDQNPDYGFNYISDVLKKFELEERWAYYNFHTESWEGPQKKKINEIISSADLLINISYSNPIRPWLLEVPIRVLIDTDPVFSQIRNLTDDRRHQLSAQHNRFFTFGVNYGKENCSIPIDGFPWLPTRQPIVLSAWPVSEKTDKGAFSTIMQWDSYKNREYKGETFAMKSASFEDFFDLPAKITDTLELAIGGKKVPTDKLLQSGWKLTNPLIVARTPESYQRYIQESKGEWSIAKHGYVVSNSGWFSERTLNYMASGKPVVIQETGFSELIPTGDGVLPFSTLDESIEQLKKVSESYEFHCRQARNIVEEYFRADKVLTELLNMIN